MSSKLKETLSKAASTIQTGWRNRKTRKRSLGEPVLEPIQQPSVPMDRQPSIIIARQGKFSNCWNHTVSRILCRFMFNILDLPYEDTLECDILYGLHPYSYGNETDSTLLTEYARTFCKGTGYTKFLLYTFFIRFFTKKFGCTTPQLTSVVLEYASTLFNTRDTFNDTIGVFLQEDENRALKMVFDETLYPLFLAFFEKKETAGWNINYVSTSFYARSPGILQSVLDKGLYISILMFLGNGPFKKSFNNYRKGRELYHAVLGSTSKTNGHIMTIVGYTYVTFRNGVRRILLHIKNSWGRKWGIDGMFYFYLNDLGGFYTVFDWLEPSDPSVLTFKTTPMTITEDQFQHDYVLKYREKNAELLTAMENNEYDKFVPLVDAGADINILDERLDNSPLGIAIQTNNTKLCKQLLLRDANVNETILGTTTPFILALTNNEIKILRLILAFSTDLDAEVYIRAITYLCATYDEIDSNEGKEQRLNTMHFLFDHIRYQKNILRSLFIDPTPENDILLNSIKKGNDRLIQLLLEYGADPNLQGPLHEKRIQKANMVGLDSIVQILRDAGAREDDPLPPPSPSPSPSPSGGKRQHYRATRNRRKRVTRMRNSKRKKYGHISAK